MKNNIDEDIKILKNPQKMELTQLIRTFKREGIENFVTVKKEHLENVLLELEKREKRLNRQFKLFQRKDKEILHLNKELETYKKIAEKLAGYGFNCYYGSPLKFDSPEELIEVARKETEDEELARKEVEKDDN